MVKTMQTKKVKDKTQKKSQQLEKIAVKKLPPRAVHVHPEKTSKSLPENADYRDMTFETFLKASTPLHAVFTPRIVEEGVYMTVKRAEEKSSNAPLVIISNRLEKESAWAIFMAIRESMYCYVKDMPEDVEKLAQETKDTLP